MYLLNKSSPIYEMPTAHHHSTHPDQMKRDSMIPDDTHSLIQLSYPHYYIDYGRRLNLIYVARRTKMETDLYRCKLQYIRCNIPNPLLGNVSLN